MAMKASAIRFDQDEREWISAFAQLNGTTFSAQVRQWTLERLEDELDARDLADAIRSDDGERLSMDEVLAMCEADR